MDRFKRSTHVHTDAKLRYLGWKKEHGRLLLGRRVKLGSSMQEVKGEQGRTLLA